MNKQGTVTFEHIKEGKKSKGTVAFRHIKKRRSQTTSPLFIFYSLCE